LPPQPSGPSGQREAGPRAAPASGVEASRPAPAAAKGRTVAGVSGARF